LPSSFRSVLVPVFYWLFAAVPAVGPFVQVLRRPWLVRIAVVEFPELLWAAYKIPCGVLDRIRIVAFLAYPVL
jgi:hypothetical protein